jgi:epoxyqueuosine reductase
MSSDLGEKKISAADAAALVKRAAADAGFDLCGIAPVSDPPDLNYFSEWIDAGRAGEMKYMAARDERGELKRSSLARVAPWARSVIVCAINYNTDHPYSTQVQDPTRGWISRYAWSHEDYHNSVLHRLQQVEAAIREGLSAESLARLTMRSYVDTGPIVERAFAGYAGVGWIGKNTCLINQKKGSWLFLGVILTSLEMHADMPAPDRCGTCTRCIEACPTQAFIAPHQLDANKCISYLTIEKRGAIPESLREGIGRHVFGCDICQDVCPWNRKAPVSTGPEFEPRPGLVNPALEWLAGISEEEFRSAFRGSPIRRVKRNGLRRNAAIAMGNTRQRHFLPDLEKLAADTDNSVAESARWAADRILNNRNDLSASQNETDPSGS